MSNASHHHYLRKLGLVMLAGVLLVASVVVLADPYGLYGVVRKPGLNADKPVPQYFRNRIKLSGAQRLGATQFLLGNSRVEVGFDPDSPVLGGGAYNLGLAGTGTMVAVGQLQYLRGLGVKPSRVIAGVDFHDALLAPGQKGGVRPVPKAGVESLGWRVESLFSLAALHDAATTFAMQGDREAETMTERGLNPLNQYKKFARYDGYYKIFRQRAEESAASLVRKAPGGLDRDGLRAELRGLFDGAASDNPGVDVRLMVYAYHAQLLALYEASGIWPRFEEWKRIVLEEAEAARGRYPQAHIVVHDFSGFGEFNCETIPGPNEKGSTHWYWEAGHQKPALGEEMLRRMLGGAPESGFGMALTLQNLEQDRQRIAAERATCAAAHPALFAEAHELVARAASRQ
ncbi:hypothetical protein [Duganella sp. Root1480D1]|uniref:hypothetical protein n=1 Tax=Duganella sp. Root1480D1 TaxID=1736471 RepID=UPI00070D5800|nr:hypothetical protein [Duganella sp. Root1480D1]KQZ44295.1 hypothetical protein ASD58_19025 [Duganella sp. Root1480D1]